MKSESQIVFISVSIDEFFIRLREIVKEEIGAEKKESETDSSPTHTMVTNRPYLTILEATQLLKCSRPFIYSLIRSKQLAKKKLRGRVYFLVQDVEALMK